MRFICLIIAFLLMGCANTPSNQPSDLTRIATVEAFFDALYREDAGAATALLTNDAMVHAPYNPNGDASDAAIRSFPAALYVRGAMQTYNNLLWNNRRYSRADDGQTLWVEAQGKLTVAATGRPYHNRYVFKIEFSDANIAAITEYTNVATLTNDGVTAQVR